MAGLFGEKNRTAGLAGGEADRAVFIIAVGVSRAFERSNSLNMSNAHLCWILYSLTLEFISPVTSPPSQTVPCLIFRSIVPLPTLSSYASVRPVSLHLGFRPLLIYSFSCRLIWVASLWFLDMHLTFNYQLSWRNNSNLTYSICNLHGPWSRHKQACVSHWNGSSY